MGKGIPLGAAWVSVLVFLYSFCNLTLVVLLVCLLWSFGERLTYVSLLCSLTAISTTASIVQQFHYAIYWEDIKEAQFENALEGLKKNGVAFGGAAGKIDSALFFVQFYCYNSQALIVFFWAMALFNGAWGFRSNWLGNWRNRIGPMSKAFAVLFPTVIVVLEHTSIVRTNLVGFFVVSYTTMLTSMTLGSILLALMLYKYIKTRRLVAGSTRRGGWWGSASKQSNSSSNVSRDVGADGTQESGRTTNTRTSIYDRVLVTRFTIGFVILAVFEVVLIVFSLFQSSNNAAIAASGHPNHTVSSTIIDIVLFVPGVTPSLVTFLVFGTTKSWRQYRDMVFGSCGIRRRMIERRTKPTEANEHGEPGLEFTRLESLPSIAAQGPQAGSKGKEAEKRVRMFVKEVRSIDKEIDNFPSGSNSSAGGPPHHTRTASSSQHTQAAPSIPSPTSTFYTLPENIGVGISSRVHDPTIQPGRRREAWEMDGPLVEGVQQQLQPRRFGSGVDDPELQLGVLPPAPLARKMSREEVRWQQWPGPKGDGSF